MQHNRFRICPMQRYLCFRIILLQVQIRQANNVWHLFSPLLQSRASRASRVRGFSFYMARCSRLWRVSILSTLSGQCPEPIRAPAYSSYLRRSAYRLRRPKHRSAAPDRSIKSSHGRIRAVSPVGGVTPGSSDSPGVSSR